MCRWTQWDGTGRTRPFLDPSAHTIYFYRQYIAGRGYAGGDSNQLILNFKKRVAAPQNELKHKDKAIKQCARELIGLFQPDLVSPFCMTWIPPSKAKTDPAYDNRMEQVVDIVCRELNFAAVEVLQSKATRLPLHHGNIRDPSYIGSNLQWANCSLDRFNGVFIFDDVLTTGASFRTVHDEIRTKYPSLPIYGLFWAITVDI